MIDWLMPLFAKDSPSSRRSNIDFGLRAPPRPPAPVGPVEKCVWAHVSRVRLPGSGTRKAVFGNAGAGDAVTLPRGIRDGQPSGSGSSVSSQLGGHRSKVGVGRARASEECRDGAPAMNPMRRFR